MEVLKSGLSAAAYMGGSWLLWRTMKAHSNRAWRLRDAAKTWDGKVSQAQMELLERHPTWAQHMLDLSMHEYHEPDVWQEVVIRVCRLLRAWERRLKRRAARKAKQMEDRAVRQALLLGKAPPPSRSAGSSPPARTATATATAPSEKATNAGNAQVATNKPPQVGAPGLAAPATPAAAAAAAAATPTQPAAGAPAPVPTNKDGNAPQSSPQPAHSSKHRTWQERVLDERLQEAMLRMQEDADWRPYGVVYKPTAADFGDYDRFLQQYLNPVRRLIRQMAFDVQMSSRKDRDTIEAANQAANNLLRDCDQMETLLLPVMLTHQ